MPPSSDEFLSGSALAWNGTREVTTACRGPSSRVRPASLAPLLFDCDWIHGRSDGPGDGQRRRAEKEFVHAVVRAVRAEVLQIKNLTHTDTDHRDHDPVPSLAGNI